MGVLLSEAEKWKIGALRVFDLSSISEQRTRASHISIEFEAAYCIVVRATCLLAISPGAD